MARPIVLTGVIHGKTITLDDETLCPPGYRVTLHLILEPDEALRLSAGSWRNMTAEQVTDFEAYMTEVTGEPYTMPGPEDE